MNFEDFAAALVGEWRGTKLLYLEPPPAPAISSPSKLSATPIAGASFLEFRYEWTYGNEAQHGVLLLGHDDENAASAAWVDSFHMSSKILFCTGTAEEGSAEVLGAYAAPPGPDWGWRVTIRPISAAEFRIVMHNISPEGAEDLAVQIDYTRAG